MYYIYLPPTPKKGKNEICDWYIMSNLKHASVLKQSFLIGMRAKSPRHVYTLFLLIQQKLELENTLKGLINHWNLQKYHKLWLPVTTKKMKVSSS